MLYSETSMPQNGKGRNYPHEGATLETVDLLITHASELLTCRQPPQGPDADLEIVADGAVAIRSGRVVATGTTSDLSGRYKPHSVYDAAGRLVSPGLVDPHTHLVHAGSRHHDWEAHVTGQPSAGLAGGIAWSIEQTRSTADDELRHRALADLDLMLAHGTTTVEAKSGYGLDRQTELRLLRITASLDHPVEVVTTYLGAHVLPRAYQGRRDDYVDLVISLLPEARQYAQYCDVCCDPVGFTNDECRRIALAAQDLGFGIRVHADQTGDARGAELAAEVNATSVDHLEAVSSVGVQALVGSSVTAVLVPGVAFHMTETIPARDGDDRGWSPPRLANVPAWADKLSTSGLRLALATDYNPGTSPTPSMQMAMQLAARLYRFTSAQIWLQATINAASALDRSDRVGSLEPDKHADIVIWSVPEHGMVINRFGINLADVVIKRGVVVHTAPHPRGRDPIET